MNTTDGLVRVKVLCGQCRDLLCRIVDTADGDTFYRVPYGGGAETFSPDLVFCAKHGWPDFDSPDLAAQLAAARETGTVKTHRARVSGKRPRMGSR